VGAVTIRGNDLDNFVHFLGLSQTAQQTQQTKVETYAHRTLLVWLGFEIWKDHPLLGVGWEGSAEPGNFEPYIPAAHKRFPDETPLAFPAPDRRYGLALWVATFAAAAALAARAAIRLGSGTALLGLLWTALLVWLWTAQGYVAGIPLDALTWLAFGFAVTRLPGPETEA
jgi:O-antigen ligase